MDYSKNLIAPFEITLKYHGTGMPLTIDAILNNLHLHYGPVTEDLTITGSLHFNATTPFFLQIYQHELIFPFFGIMITTNGEQACKTEIAQIRLSRNAQNAMRFKKQIITPNKKANINLSILFHPFI